MMHRPTLAIQCLSMKHKAKASRQEDSMLAIVLSSPVLAMVAQMMVAQMMVAQMMVAQMMVAQMMVAQMMVAQMMVAQMMVAQMMVEPKVAIRLDCWLEVECSDYIPEVEYTVSGVLVLVMEGAMEGAMGAAGESRKASQLVLQSCRY